VKGLHETNRFASVVEKLMFDQKPPTRLRWKKCVPVRETSRILLLVERVQKDESILKSRWIESILFENRS